MAHFTHTSSINYKWLSFPDGKPSNHHVSTMTPTKSQGDPDDLLLGQLGGQLHPVPAGSPGGPRCYGIHGHLDGENDDLPIKDGDFLLATFKNQRVYTNSYDENE